MERIKRLTKFCISFILYTKENLDNLVLKEYYKFKVLKLCSESLKNRVLYLALSFKYKDGRIVNLERL